MKLFIVGKYIKGLVPDTVWEFIGIFDDEVKALEACIYKNYFIGPVTLNESFPDKTVLWPGLYYPLAFDEKEV